MQADLAELRESSRIAPDVRVVEAPLLYEPPWHKPVRMPSHAHYTFNCFEQVFYISQDGPFVLFDVMASRGDIVVEVEDAGANAIRGRYAGPWLARRQLALAELLETVVDMATAKRTENLVSVLTEAIQRQPEWVHPVVFPPASAIKARIVPLEGAPDGPCTVWLRGERWTAL